jgi:hypothetical protein
MALAPHTANVADLLAMDRDDLAAAVHEAAATHLHGTLDYATAAALLEAPWDELGDPPPALGAPHTADVANMLHAGQDAACRDFHNARATAELERQEPRCGQRESSRCDMWMAGVLCEADISVA